MPQNNASDYLRLHLAVLVFGITGPLGQLISIEAVPLVWHRMWLAAAFVFFFLLFKKRLDFSLIKNPWKVLLAGVIIAAHWVTFFHSIKISTVSVALACVSTGAFFGSLIEPIVFQRKPRASEMLLGLAVIVGLYFIFRFEGGYWEGIVVALISAFLSALFSVLNSKMVRSQSAFRITFLEMLGGFLAIGIFLSLTGKMSWELFALSCNDWVFLVILGSVCTAFAFIESVAVMRRLSAFTFLLAINLEPVYGILLALWIFGESEQMEWGFYVGAAIILSTVFVDVWLRKRRRVGSK